MAYDSVWVLTSKSLETMVKEGGSGNWRARRSRIIRRARYVVAIRNGHSGWSEDDKGHGTAFLVGRISGVMPSPPSEPGRWVIQFDQYALVNKPKVWPKRHRNPVTYSNLRDMGIDPENLKWQDFPSSKSVAKPASVINQKVSDVVERAKSMIAAALSINPTAVQITITI